MCETMSASFSSDCDKMNGVALFPVLPAGLVAMLLDLGQGCKQHVPRGQQHAMVEEQQQLLQRVEELL